MRPEIIVTTVVTMLISAVIAYCLCVIAGQADEEAEIARKNLEKEKRKNEEKSDDFSADGREN